MTADILWQIYYGGYITADTLRHIYIRRGQHGLRAFRGPAAYPQNPFFPSIRGGFPSPYPSTAPARPVRGLVLRQAIGARRRVGGETGRLGPGLRVSVHQRTLHVQRRAGSVTAGGGTDRRPHPWRGNEPLPPRPHDTFSTARIAATLPASHVRGIHPLCRRRMPGRPLP